MGAKTIIYWIPVYIICSTIFYFSSLSTAPNIFVLEPSDLQKHFFVYVVLSLFSFIAISNTKSLEKNPGLYTIMFVFLFAVSDEFHQSFVAGRIGELKDIIVDFFSSLFFISIKTIIV